MEHILENVVRCKHFEAGVHVPRTQLITHIRDDLGRAIQTLDHIEGKIL